MALCAMYRRIFGFLILFRWWPNIITKSLTLSTAGLVDLNRSVGILTIGSWDSDNWKSGDSDNWKSGDSDNWKSWASDNWKYLFKEKEIIQAV